MFFNATVTQSNHNGTQNFSIAPSKIMFLLITHTAKLHWSKLNIRKSGLTDWLYIAKVQN